MESWRKESEALNTELKEIRNNCMHPLVNKKKQWNEDEYGKMLSSGWVDYRCEDCGLHWTEDFEE